MTIFFSSVYSQWNWRKPVHVRSHFRFRHNKWEFVREHWRAAWGSKVTIRVA